MTSSGDMMMSFCGLMMTSSGDTMTGMGTREGDMVADTCTWTCIWLPVIHSRNLAGTPPGSAPGILVLAALLAH